MAHKEKLLDIRTGKLDTCRLEVTEREARAKLYQGEVRNLRVQLTQMRKTDSTHVEQIDRLQKDRLPMYEKTRQLKTQRNVLATVLGVLIGGYFLSIR